MKKLTCILLIAAVLVSSVIFTLAYEVQPDVTDVSSSRENVMYLGDANLDGEVDIIDATHIQRFELGIIELSEKAMNLADVDKNGAANIIDAMYIQRWELHLPAPDGIGEPVDPHYQRINWHQCPDDVRAYLAYMEENPYQDDDYSRSDILTFASVNQGVVSNTKPVGLTIGDTTYYDNIPNVDVPFTDGETYGVVRFVDKVRWINTTYQTEEGASYPRGANTRDIGGWSCGTGRDGNPCTVKYGMIIRGGEPNAADRELMVDKLGIRSELQLLPVTEQAADRLMKSVWGIDWYGNDTVYSVYGIVDEDYNRNLWKKYLAAVFDSTANGKPIYIHCGIGADRTGSVMIMLEAILGMTENEIAQDYELTNFAFYQDSTSPRRRNTQAYQGYMSAIKSVSLAAGLSDTFENHAISYALSLGFTVQQINAYRNACIDGDPVQIAVG